jgi:hypothetical protein
MLISKVDPRVVEASGLPEEIKDLAGQEVYVYPDTKETDGPIKSVGIIPRATKIIDPEKPDERLMLCIDPEFLVLNAAQREYFGL